MRTGRVTTEKMRTWRKKVLTSEVTSSSEESELRVWERVLAS